MQRLLSVQKFLKVTVYRTVIETYKTKLKTQFDEMSHCEYVLHDLKAIHSELLTQLNMLWAPCDKSVFFLSTQSLRQ